jgi:hypothetical protein
LTADLAEKVIVAERAAVAALGLDVNRGLRGASLHAGFGEGRGCHHP